MRIHKQEDRSQKTEVGMPANHQHGSTIIRNPTRGGALLTVLWLSAGLAAIAFSVSSSVRTETERVSTSADGLRAAYLASGAVERGIQWIIWGGAYRNPDGSPRFWDRQSRLSMWFPGGAALVDMIPESSKLSINRASPEDLYRVVLAVSGDPDRSRQIVEAILDWRGVAPAPTVFDQYYFTLNPTFRARHTSFQEIEELLLVRGMTPELFYGNYIADENGRLYARGGLRDCLSVWGSLGPFDLNTASPALMEAMGIAPDVSAAIVARRQSRPFRNMQDAQDAMATAAFVPRFAIGAAGNATLWTLRAAARLRRPDGTFSDVVRTAAATVQIPRRARPGGPLTPLQVLRWYDDAWSQAIIPPNTGMPPATGNVPEAPVTAEAGLLQ
jgi:general secretion pathway protein K